MTNHPKVFSQKLKIINQFFLKMLKKLLKVRYNKNTAKRIKKNIKKDTEER